MHGFFTLLSKNYSISQKKNKQEKGIFFKKSKSRGQIASLKMIVTKQLGFFQVQFKYENKHCSRPPTQKCPKSRWKSNIL